MANAVAAETFVTFETNYGKIVLELYSEKAPLTVENFLHYVKSGHYDGILFHRVIKGFMVQGGGYDLNFKEKKTDPPIKNEADNGLKNLRGTIAMARTSEPNSATAQFFINHVDNSFLDYTSNNPGYAVFGKVIEGMDAVDKIALAKTKSYLGMRDVPVEPIIINKATVDLDKK
ncbi:MAG: peptidyl-prolyl cis-trans isomerase [Deferribacteraceae bacterium]|nr:peptidyl-prolyl cis-trans isomerase [Deferribacteraceae bacterium]